MRAKIKNAQDLRLPVREAKNRFSELVRLVARGREIIITSHGEPRARLSPLKGGSRPLKVDWKWLEGMKVSAPNTAAETLIRAERDGRD